MDSKILLSSFLLDAVANQLGALYAPATNGCVSCEGGPCEEMGCQSCQCAYESSQCGACLSCQCEAESSQCTACQDTCQSQSACTNACEHSCQSTCQTSCQGGCQGACQNCQGQSCSQTPTLTDPSWHLESTKTSISVIIDSKGSYTYFKFSLLLNGTTIQGPTSYMSVSRYTFSGLTANTRYGVYMNWSRNTSAGEGGSSQFITTDTISIGRVNYSNAGAIQSGQPLTIYASDFNHFRNTIYEIYSAKGLPASPFNEDIASGIPIQAKHINNFYFRITYLGGTFYQVSAGQTISAKVFLDLRNAINSIIDNL